MADQRSPGSTHRGLLPSVLYSIGVKIASAMLIAVEILIVGSFLFRYFRAWTSPATPCLSSIGILPVASVSGGINLQGGFIDCVGSAYTTPSTFNFVSAVIIAIVLIRVGVAGLGYTHGSK